MSKQDAPAQPPSYQEAVTTGGSNKKAGGLQVPEIPADRRRSMEDEHRSLPRGWVRQYDDRNHHQFFVDTNADPPRSIWHHPYDDEDYLSTLDSDERERIQEEEDSRRRPLTPGSIDEKHSPDSKSGRQSSSAEQFPSSLPQRPDPNHKKCKSSLVVRVPQCVD